MVHPFFEVLRAALVTKTGERGRILFQVVGLEEERIAVDLGQSVAIAAPDFTADLIIFCDRPQLDAMLESGFTARALRWSGDVSVLDRLALLMKTAQSPIATRGGR
jgi:hypothetical protein